MILKLYHCPVSTHYEIQALVSKQRLSLIWPGVCSIFVNSANQPQSANYEKNSTALKFFYQKVAKFRNNIQILNLSNNSTDMFKQNDCN